MPRKLRITASACFGALALAIAALWIWNHWNHDFSSFSRTEIHFAASRIVLHINPSPGGKSQFLRTMSIEESWQYVDAIHRNDNRWGFGHVNDWGTHIYITPHWFYFLVAITAAALPWTHSRFSLRTLLLVTTLVALALGLIVWRGS